MILRGNCLDTLKTLADCSIDSIVTDPPYELGFMGKSWDNSGIAYSQDLWRECLRVLKPGGHLLAFSGSRTYHRMTVAIEDAGFEIRDQIMWLYGSGFPKSLDVSKAIDKSDATEARRKRDLRFTEWMRSTGITSKQIDEATGTSMGGHYLSSASQPAVATAEMFDLLRPHLPHVPAEIEEMVRQRTIESENYKRREVVGTRRQRGTPNGVAPFNTASSPVEELTVPATPEAQRWQGWGTALKPAHEPICVARKPLTGTVASNVLEWGTGALNIDGSRVGTEGGTARDGLATEPTEAGWANMKGHGITKLNTGRWPANVIHDGSDEVLAGFPNSVGQRALNRRGATTGTSIGGNGRLGTASPQEVMSGYDDSGSAARYFYCAKASKSERNAGLDKPNSHPTVKPIALMRYLVKLVTPPGGTVLDPFLGSGSTAVAAIIEGFEWVGCEMTEDYWPIIEARVAWAEAQPRTLL